MLKNIYILLPLGAIFIGCTAGIIVTPSEVISKVTPSEIVSMEFIYTEATPPSCHASTIAETESGLVAAWFGGTREGHLDVGIWVSRNEGQGWTPPVEVANGIESDTLRYPCWNPVLFQSQTGPLMLFYKVGPSPSSWWGMVRYSDDDGKTWSQPRRLPDGILGPIKNKPIQLADGTLLCPSSSEHAGYRVHFEHTPDLGKTWEQVGPINNAEEFGGVIQPTLLTYSDGRIQALCRSRQSWIVESWSSDGGHTWSKLEATVLPNPHSGIDAVTLRDGRHLMVYNHTAKPPDRWGGPRSPLNVAVSSDGINWQAALELENEPGEFSYPAVIQTADGLVHITYTWQRTRVRHAVLDPSRLVLRDMPQGQWPH
ncbi:exo-alpha-sialidase [Candidatus Neomarinimicrobiota bacterium]